MDLGSVSLSRLICEKLLDSYVSKLAVLAVGLNSALVACDLVTCKPDPRRSLNLLVCNQPGDQRTVKLVLGGHPDLVDHTLHSTRKTRAENYKAGGIFLVSKMKFCLDVLEELIDPQKVDKIIYVNEYRLSEFDPLSLTTNILKRFNEVLASQQDLLVMALTNDPFKTLAGENFASLMQHLYLRDCQFWPTYREEVKQHLAQNKLQVDSVESS